MTTPAVLLLVAAGNETTRSALALGVQAFDEPRLHENVSTHDTQIAEGDKVVVGEPARVRSNFTNALRLPPLAARYS